MGRSFSYEEHVDVDPATYRANLDKIRRARGLKSDADVVRLVLHDDEIYEAIVADTTPLGEVSPKDRLQEIDPLVAHEVSQYALLVDLESEADTQVA